MRVTGSVSDSEERVVKAPTQGYTAPEQQMKGARPQSAPVGFEPFAFHGFPGMMAPPPSYSLTKPRIPSDRRRVYFSEPEATGESSTEDVQPLVKQRVSKLPPFAEKWFDLRKERKDELRQLKQKWVAEQQESGHTEAHKDVEGMKKVLPKFAAKWFVLPEEEKEAYRAVKKAKKLKKTGGLDIPSFAAKWFALSEKKKREFRAIKKRLQKSKKAWLSDGDEEEGQSDTAINYTNEGMPPFAAKWFALPKDKKDEIRVKYHHHKKCKKHDCKGLERMMSLMHLQGHGAPMPATMHPYAPYAGYPMPWMGPYYQQGYPMYTQQTQPMYNPAQAMYNPAQPMYNPAQPMYNPAQPMYNPAQPQMYQQCPAIPSYCMMKRFYRQQERMRKRQLTSDSSDDEATKRPIASTDSDSSDEEEVPQMPSFVKKWFSLPMEAHMQLRMLKRMQKDGKCKTNALPTFAKKWFALSEKKKQEMRKLKRLHKHEHKAEDSDDVTSDSPRDLDSVDVKLLKSDKAAKKDIPEFARIWFALPLEQKCHWRMLNKYLSSKSGAESSDDEFDERMPDYAVQWFALSSDERQHLRNLKHEKMSIIERQRNKKAWKRFGSLQGGNPWQQWAFHSAPFMGYFGGKKRGHYEPVTPEKQRQDGYFD